jgi:hypothetical protein
MPHHDAASATLDKTNACTKLKTLAILLIAKEEVFYGLVRRPRLRAAPVLGSGGFGRARGEFCCTEEEGPAAGEEAVAFSPPG